MKSRGGALGAMEGRRRRGGRMAAAVGVLVCGGGVQQQQVPWGAREQEGAEGGTSGAVVRRLRLWVCCVWRFCPMGQVPWGAREQERVKGGRLLCCAAL